MTAGRTLAVAAIDLAQGATLEDWQTRMHRSAPAVCTDSDPPIETTLDGERALTWTAACVSEGLNVIKLAALRGTRAYMVLFASPTASTDAADQAAFDSIMRTFHFVAG